MKKYLLGVFCVGLLNLSFGFSALAIELPDTEINVDNGALVAPSTTALPRTFGYLTYVVDRLMTASRDAGDVSAQSCSTLDTLFMSQSEIDRESFAWNSDSYILPEKLFTQVSDIQELLYLQSREKIIAISQMLDSIGVASNNVLTANHLEAVYRSSLIEIANEYRKESGPDGERVDALLSFAETHLTCISQLADTQVETVATLQTLTEDMSALENFWLSNRMYVQGVPLDAGETMNILITPSDLTSEKYVTAITDVVTVPTLELYAKTLMQQQERIRAIQLTSTDTRVVYAIDAKLFGVAKIFLNEKIVVDATGNPDVSLPWYSFLATKKMQHRQEIVDAIRLKLSDNTAMGNSIASVEKRAHVLESIVVSLE